MADERAAMVKICAAILRFFHNVDRAFLYIATAPLHCEHIHACLIHFPIERFVTAPFALGGIAYYPYTPLLFLHLL